MRSDDSEVNIRGSENILTVSINVNSVDASIQTSPTRSCVCHCAEMMSDIKKLMSMITALQDEVSSHGMDIYEIRKKTDSVSVLSLTYTVCY